MKLIQRILLIGLTMVLLSSCAKVFYTPDARALASKQQIIAIIPPTISIAAARRVEAEAIKEQQNTESINFQKEIHTWMLRRKMQGKITTEIQGIETTNALLKRAGYPENPKTTAELCEILGVDGVMTSNFALSKPMSEVAAVAVNVLIGAWGATNEVRATLSISDCANNKLIWNFEHKLSGGLGSSPARIVDQLMRQASRRMPYIVK